MSLGSPSRTELGDTVEYPTVRLHTGEEVPVHLLSSGVRRIVEIAYLLVWSWLENDFVREHYASHPNLALGNNLTQFVLLVDEVELHLHPKWQRTVLPALSGLIDSLHSYLPANSAKLQTLVTTHSPLVLASMETHFKSDADGLFPIEKPLGSEVIEPSFLEKEGDITNWLRDYFKLGEAMSIEAEQAISLAKSFMRGTVSADVKLEAVEAKLKSALHPQDEFMYAWNLFKELGNDDSISET